MYLTRSVVDGQLIVKYGMTNGNLGKRLADGGRRGDYDTRVLAIVSIPFDVAKADRGVRFRALHKLENLLRVRLVRMMMLVMRPLLVSRRRLI